MHHVAVLITEYAWSSIRTGMEETVRQQRQTFVGPFLYNAIFSGPSPWDRKSASIELTSGCGGLIIGLSPFFLLVIILSAFKSEYVTSGDRPAARGNPAASRSHLFLHHGVDDHSRLGCPEILRDEKKETAAAFWEQARGFFLRRALALPRYSPRLRVQT